jgi:hypothetical protein
VFGTLPHGSISPTLHTQGCCVSAGGSRTYQNQCARVSVLGKFLLDREISSRVLRPFHNTSSYSTKRSLVVGAY